MSIWNLFRRRAHEREMDAEMRFHIDMEAAELERAGIDPVEARRRALAAFGGVQRYKEEGHAARGGASLEDIARDVRYSLRSLLRTPGYAAIVVLTLALGIAATTSIFSVANGVLFKRLPYRDPAKLLVVWDGLDAIGVPEAWVTGPEVVRMRTELKTFEGIATIRSNTATIGSTDGAEPEQVPTSMVSANFFQLLGAGPEIGRGFVAGEDAPGAPRVAVLSHRLWTQRYGADRGLVGTQIMVDGAPMTVIGILPERFRYSAQNSLSSASGVPEMYVPFPDTLAGLPPSNHSLGVLARVRADVPTPDAMAELSALGHRLDDTDYSKRGFTFKPVFLQERMVRDVRPALLVLLAAVALLLLIMCANLAVLALVRTARREREITVRRAIGANTGRVARQILTETILLSAAGAAGGTLLGIWTLRALLAMAPAGLPRRSEIGIDVTVLLVMVAVTVVVGIGMGLAPAFHSARADIASVLREKSPSRSGRRVRHTLVLAQLALSMVLLAGTGLLLSSFVRLMHVDPGFNPANVLTIELVAPRSKYAAQRDVFAIVQRYADVLRTVPGVVAVGATSAPPLSANADQSGAYFPGSPTNTGDRRADGILVDNAAATPGYFEAMGISLAGGQGFDDTETDSLARRVTVIDDVLAKRYFPDGRAVGQYMTLDGDSLRIVGVARHVRMYNLQDPGREQLWLPHAYATYRFMIVTVRTKGDPVAIAAAARRAIRRVDADQPIISMRPMTDRIHDSLAERRLVLTLVAAFGGAALLLVALGVYGVTASTVAQRTRELGIRVALGANRGAVVWSVLSEPTRLVGTGLAIGLAGTFAAGRVVERLLYGVRPTDPVTLVAVAFVLLVVALIAGYVPARRATRVDPITALRAD
ncbi:MAG TPA: ABC transporter permease [Gemmatimonadaceae bacterium]|nr:ABC transporter permease [Gemmatimonadaceae bacterium]